jgi:hypothetical protein
MNRLTLLALLPACAGSTLPAPPQDPRAAIRPSTFQPKSALIVQKNVDAYTGSRNVITHSYILIFERAAVCEELDAHRNIPNLAAEPHLDVLLQAVWPQPANTTVPTNVEDALHDHVDWAILKRPGMEATHLKGTITVERSNPAGGLLSLDLRDDELAVRSKVSVVTCPE